MGIVAKFRKNHIENRTTIDGETRDEIRRVMAESLIRRSDEKPSKKAFKYDVIRMVFFSLLHVLTL